jgi:ribosomal protein L17
MRKRFSKVLLGKKSERRGAMINQLKSIFTYGKIKVSTQSAKQLVRLIDRVIARVKDKENLVATRYLIDIVGDVKLANTILEYSKNALKIRNSGFSTVVRHIPRRGDGMEESTVELIDFVKVEKKPVDTKKPKVVKKDKEKESK